MISNYGNPDFLGISKLFNPDAGQQERNEPQTQDLINTIFKCDTNSDKSVTRGELTECYENIKTQGRQLAVLSILSPNLAMLFKPAAEELSNAIKHLDLVSKNFDAFAKGYSGEKIDVCDIDNIITATETDGNKKYFSNEDLENLRATNFGNDPYHIPLENTEIQRLAGLENLDNVNFNENKYLEENPDVAAAVEAGVFETGYAHFMEHGLREGRGFDEQKYLEENTKVAEAIKKHGFASGLDHFIEFGAEEGRKISIKYFEPKE